MNQRYRGLLFGGLLLLLLAFLWFRFGGPGSIEVAFGFALLFGLGTLLLLTGVQAKGTLMQRVSRALLGYLLIGLLIAALQSWTRPDTSEGASGSRVSSFIGETLLWPIHLTDWLPLAPDLRAPP